MIQEDIQVRWWNLEAKLKDRFGKKPDVESILYLIGIQETGLVGQSFTKEQKQDLMHVAICSILMVDGYYIKEGIDKDGWPHFTQVKELPAMQAYEQEQFLKDYILLYFQNQGF